MQQIYRLQLQLPRYLTYAAAWASNMEIDRGDLADYTEKILLFWRTNGTHFLTWAFFARAAFSMAPSSAAVERVFSLANNMFGDGQLNSLADYVHADLGHAALQQARRWLGEELCGVGRCNVLPNA